MSGVVVIRHLLSVYAPILAVVPASRIMGGDFSLSLARPCIVVTQVDSDDFRTIKRGGRTLVFDRVQASPLFNGPRATLPGTGYQGLVAMMKLLPKACPNQRGMINGIDVDSIDLELEGPDLTDEGTQMYSRSRDFIVRYYEDRA